MAPETRTRTRKAPSQKEEQTNTEQEAAKARAAEVEAEKAAKEAKRAEEKAAREAEKTAEKEAKDKAKAEEKAAKEKERADARQALIDAGQLIETEDDGVTTTYTVSEPKKDAVAQRAAEVIQRLKDEGTEVPVHGKDLADEFGGGTVQWVAFFGMLRILGLVRVYRFKTGERGGSGLSYLWIGPVEDESGDED